MSASLVDIKRWFDEGVQKNMQHMLVMTDTTSRDSFPVYVPIGKDPVEFRRDDKFVRTDECYILNPARREEQLAKRRAFHWGDRLV